MQIINGAAYLILELDSISNQDSVRRMFNSISLKRGGTVSVSTRKTFTIYLQRFFEFCGQTPDEMIKERMDNWKSDDIFTRRRHEEKLMEFAQYMRSEGYTSNTVSTAVGAVRSLYRTNYLPMTEVNIPSGRPVRVYKVPTKEELIKAIDRASASWHKAFMLLTKDCGISLQDMLALKLGDGSPIYGSINQQIRKGQVPIHLQIVREKTLFTYDTFLGEDSFEILNDEVRFPDLKHSHTTGDKRLLPHAGSTIREAMKRIGDHFGWKSFCPYSLRKWFRTELTLDDCNDALIELWMGHSLGRVRRAYIVPPVERQKEAYKRHYRSLKLH